MEDREIIKALECCSTKGANCKDCPAFVKVDRSNCKKVLLGAIDIINRLQAEKQNLEVELKAMRGAANAYKAENERLEKNIETETNHITRLENQIERLLQRIKTIKAEAYKECIEKVKEKSKKSEIVCSGALVTTSYLISAKNLNNLLKELVGEDK